MEVLRLCAAADHPSDAPAPVDRSAGPMKGALTRHPYVMALTVILFVWGVFLIEAGTLFSGYQFADDHEILRIDADIHAPGGSVAGVLKDWVRHDLTIRFRPAYFAHRVLLTSLLGTNLEVWGIHQGMLGVLSAFLLFAFCLRLGFTWGQAMLFPLLVLMGKQAAAFWRTGPPEAFATPMVALTMWLMGESVFRATRTRMWLTLFLISAGIMSLCKESFFLLLPALAFWRVWLTKTAKEMTWREAARRNVIPAIILCVLCAAETAVTRYCVGTTVAGYAGVDRIDAVAAIQTLYATFKSRHLWLILAGLVIAAIVSSTQGRRVDWRGLAALRDFVPAAVLCALIVLPQGFLYAKSGFFERYVIPAVFGFSFFLLWTWRWLAVRQRHAAVVFFVLLSAYGIYEVKPAHDVARRWSTTGEWTGRFLTTVGERTRADSRVLIVGDPARNQEAVLAMKAWLETKNGCRDLCVLRVFNPPYTAVEDGLLAGPEFSNWFPGRAFDDAAKVPPADVVLLMQGSDGVFRRQAPRWLTPEAYDRIVFGGPAGFTVYARKTP